MSALGPSPEQSSIAASHRTGRPLLHLRLDRAHVGEYWPLCGKIADFVATFCIPEAGRQPVLTASTVVNELVENAVKYGVHERLELQAWTRDEVLTVEVYNRATTEQAGRLEAAIDSLGWVSTEERIRAQDRADSGLGLQSIIEQHHATIGLDTKPVSGATAVEVVVRVELPFHAE